MAQQVVDGVERADNRDQQADDQQDDDDCGDADQSEPAPKGELGQPGIEQVRSSVSHATAPTRV